jgi:hypothetical protein
MAEHVVKKVSDLDYQTSPEFVGRSSGYEGEQCRRRGRRCAGDYGLLPVGSTDAFRNTSGTG